MIDAPELGYPWVRVPLDQPLHVTIAGEPESYHVHWVRPAPGRPPTPVRCIQRDGDNCTLCAAGVGHRVRYVLPVLHDGTPKLLELGSQQYPWLVSKETSIRLHASDHHPEGQWPGHQIILGRDRPVKNAEIWVRNTGWSRISPEQVITIAGIVSTLGREQLATYRREQARQR